MCVWVYYGYVYITCISHYNLQVDHTCFTSPTLLKDHSIPHTIKDGVKSYSSCRVINTYVTRYMFHIVLFICDIIYRTLYIGHYISDIIYQTLYIEHYISDIVQCYVCLYRLLFYTLHG